MEDSDFYGREKIAKILFKIAPPVMLAQLIQAYIISWTVCL